MNWARAAAVSILIATSAVVYTQAQRSPTLRLSQADRLYREKSYAAALREYESLAAQRALPPARREEVGYRILVGLEQTKQWDRAQTQGLRFVRSHAGTVWEARGLYWLGRLYVRMPHAGWRVEGGVVRSENVPQGAGAEPERVGLAEQDEQNAGDALEAALTLYPPYRAAAHTEAEEIQLAFDLARVLRHGSAMATWAQERKWRVEDEAAWTRPGLPYQRDWAPPHKVLWLFQHIDSLGAARHDTHSQALALFAKSLWLGQYQRMMKQAALRWDNGAEKPVAIPYPGADMSPGQPVAELIARFPNDPVREQAQFALGMTKRGLGDLVGAEADFRALVTRQPHSPWAVRAEAMLAQLRAPVLMVAGAYTHQASTTTVIQTRNTPRVRMTLTRVDLHGLLARPEQLRSPETNWPDLSGEVGKTAPSRYQRGEVAAWQVTVPGAEDHAFHSVNAPLTDLAPGAYLLTASAPGARSTNLVIRSGITAIMIGHGQGAKLFAADSETGAPVAGARVLARCWWWGTKGPSTRSFTGVTGADGLCGFPIPAVARNGVQFGALVDRGQDHALITQLGANSFAGTQPSLASTVITDRPVYRPGQTMSLRVIATRTEKGARRPLTSRSLKVVICDPRGQAYRTLRVRTGEFGTAHDRILLPVGAPLGQYACVIQTDEPNPNQIGAGSFRVEEYKKPEFEVTVTPAAGRVRLGEGASARIAARYYFGGPVPHAGVTYRVYRSEFYVNHRFPRPFDCLWPSSPAPDYDYGRKVVEQGTAVTDAQGNADVRFTTQAARTGDSDARYTVEADVQDASRRVITGTGAVIASRHDVAVFLDYPHGYATAGDVVRVEIATVNPSDRPVAVEGSARVYRAATPDSHETLVHEESLSTDREGRAYLRWHTDSAGLFHIVYATHDSAGEPVRGEMNLFVEGPELAQGRFLYQSVFLGVKTPYVVEGQNTEILLVTPEPGCTVLLTEEMGGQLAGTRVITIPGRSMRVQLPVTAACAPNFVLRATMVRGGRLYAAREEVFVPPASQLLTIGVTSDRAAYHPGDRARFHLTAHDWQGRPARTELSVAVADAALAYIQGRTNADIRADLYGTLRYNDVQLGTSDAVNLAPFSKSGAAGNAPNSDMTLPPGMGLLPESPDAHFDDWGDDDFTMDGSSFNELIEYQSAGAATSLSAPMGAPRPSARMAPKTPAVASVPGAPEPLRTKFADTAFWTPAVVTDARGDADVEFTWPDNLTRWEAHVVGATAAAQVGEAEAEVTTRKEIMLRLQAPRFFVERDEVVLSANVHNASPEAQSIRVALHLGGSGLTPDSAPDTTVQVPAGEERRVDWTVRATRPGGAQITMSAECAAGSDAVRMAFPVLVHGIERATTQAGVLRADGAARLRVALPAARKPGSGGVTIELAPSLAGVMLDALPYLADYPYGCVEQTMSRFLPSVVTARALQSSGLSLRDLRLRAARLAAAQANRRPAPREANSAYTYAPERGGAPPVGDLTQGLPERLSAPVFSESRLDRMVRAGLKALAAQQHPDGGWGWWPDDATDPYMTAYVLYGLTTAQEAGHSVDTGMFARGTRYLRGQLRQDQNLARLTYEARVLSMQPASRAAVRTVAAGKLFTLRARLTPYAQALLAVALANVGEMPKAQVVLRNMENTLEVDAAGGTASWPEARGAWWCWWNDRVETAAAGLQAYVRIAPSHPNVARLARWLVNNRRGNVWGSTRETSLAIYALADYLHATRELSPDCRVTVSLDGRALGAYHLTHENALLFNGRLTLPESLLGAGTHTLTITRKGRGALYYTATTRYFSREEPIAPTGRELRVTRRYFRLLPGTAHSAAEWKPLAPRRENPFLSHNYRLLTVGGAVSDTWMEGETTRYERTPLKEGDRLASGDLVEVELQVESHNEYDYLAFEDLKPAGCEPVEVRSGEKAGLGLWSNMELRDQKVVFFVSHLPQGRRTLTYRLHAETPGTFHALPTHAYAMYASEVSAISGEQRMEVK